MNTFQQALVLLKAWKSPNMLCHIFSKVDQACIRVAHYSIVGVGGLGMGCMMLSRQTKIDFFAPWSFNLVVRSHWWMRGSTTKDKRNWIFRALTVYTPLNTSNRVVVACVGWHGIGEDAINMADLQVFKWPSLFSIWSRAERTFRHHMHLKRGVLCSAIINHHPHHRITLYLTLHYHLITPPSSSSGKKEREALQRQLDEAVSSKSSTSSSTSSTTTNWEAECNSLKLVLEIRWQTSSTDFVTSQTFSQSRRF